MDDSWKAISSCPYPNILDDILWECDMVFLRLKQAFLFGQGLIEGFKMLVHWFF